MPSSQREGVRVRVDLRTRDLFAEDVALAEGDVIPFSGVAIVWKLEEKATTHGLVKRVRLDPIDFAIPTEGMMAREEA